MKIISIHLPLVCITILLSACKPSPTGESLLPSESPCLDVNKIGVTTGLQFNDPEGNVIRSWKSPNDVQATDLAILAYPNPAISKLNIKSEKPFTDYWFVAVDCPNLCSAQPFSPEELNGADIDMDELDIKSEFLGSFSEGVNDMSLDLSEVSKGTYKIFLKLKDGQLVWQNILKIQQPSTVEAVIRYLNADCE